MTTLHVVGLPHTHTTRAYDQCAYTAKIRKFCGMMKQQGYKVILYASEENEARADEHVVCLTREEQKQHFELGQIQQVSWDPDASGWQLFNRRVANAIRQRKGDRDIICLMSGWSHRDLIAAFPHPEHLVVEVGVGYSGVATHFRVFESYMWMQTVYGEKQSAMAANGSFYDAVIPNYYNPTEFDAGKGEGKYFAFMSRMIQRKGFDIAIQACEQMGVKLKVAGVAGDSWPQHDHVEYVGLLDPAGRSKFLGNAIATFMPTLYLEPFGGVAAESMLCGTPVISTDWGAFPELIKQGVDGYRCRMMREFTRAMTDAPGLNRSVIRSRAMARFSTDVVGKQYDRYFQQLETLWAEGFYT